MTDETNSLEPSEFKLLGVVDFQEGKRLQFALGGQGIPLKLVSNPDTCTSGGCSPRVEIHAQNQHWEKVGKFLAVEAKRDLGGLDINPELHNQVFDPDKETALCPACGECFSTKLVECPGCGLGFSGLAGE